MMTKQYWKDNDMADFESGVENTKKKSEFSDGVGGVKLHHIGVAVSDLTRSIEKYESLGWVWEGKTIDDTERNVKLALLRSGHSKAVIELVCPANDRSPVNHMIRSMKHVATPYHMCYEVEEIEKTIHTLKGQGYILTAPLEPAIAF